MRQLTLRAAVIVAISLLATACGRTSSSSESVKAPVSTAAAAQPAIAARQPREWMVVDDTDYIPVVDDLTIHMSEARKAFVAKDPKAAAKALRSAGALLAGEGPGSSQQGKDAILAAAKNLAAVAASLDGDKAPSLKVLDAAIAKAHRADLERDWLVEDVATWYPYVDEPNAHFQSAHQAFLHQDFKTAAAEFRKGAAFVRIESGLAVGNAKQALRDSEQELERLAIDVEKAGVKQTKTLEEAFARANAALARSHQAKALDSWARKDAAKAEHELKAGATYLENAAAWTGTAVDAAGSAAVRDSRMLAAKLAEGAGYGVEEAGKAIDALGTAVADLGRKIEAAK